MAQISFFAGEHGLSLAFIVMSAPPLAGYSHTPMNLSGATLTWVMDNQPDRALSIVSVASGVAVYVTSSGEFRAPLTGRGQLHISFSDAFVQTVLFDVQVHGGLR